MTTVLRLLSDFNVHAASYTTVTPPSVASVVTDVVGLLNGFLFMVAPIILVILIAYAGVQRLISGTDSTQLQTSMNIIKWAIAGFVVVMCSYLIIRLALTIIGFDLGNSFGIPLPTT